MGYVVSEYLLPFSRLSFCFVDGSFPVQKLFRLMSSHLFMFSFRFPCLRSHIQKSKLLRALSDFTACVFSLGFYGLGSYVSL